MENGGGENGLIEFSNCSILNLPAHAGISRKSVGTLPNNGGGARNLLKIINNNNSIWVCSVDCLFAVLSSFCKATHS